MKLKEWAKRTGIQYITAYRWFKAGSLPVKAYQTDSGTIIVEDESMDVEMISNSSNPSSTSNDAMSLFLKKTVEFSKSNSSVEDFAAFVISNFKLKLNASESPKYSKNKPKTEEIQKHFQQFLPDQKNVEHLKTVKSLLKEGKGAGEKLPVDLATKYINEMFSHDTNVTTDICTHTDVSAYEENLAEDLASTNVDLNTTPQQINYTGSTNQVFGSSSFISSLADPETQGLWNAAFSGLPPILKTSEAKSAEEVTVPRKRGRKPGRKNQE